MAVEVSNTEAYQARVLGGILATGNTAAEARGRMIECLRYLGEDYFSGRYRALFLLVKRYFQLTNNVIGERELSDALRAAGLSEEKVVEYDELQRSLRGVALSEGEWRFARVRLIEQTRVDRFGMALAGAMEILTSGRKDLATGETVIGYEAARAHLAREQSVIDQTVGDGTPDGNINEEIREMLAEYGERKHRGIVGSLPTGISVVDRVTGGAQPGELWLLAGYAGEGKTTLACNIAWHTCYVLGKNVVFGTGETLRTQVRRKIVCRHSRLPQFECPEGLKYSEIKLGQLTPERERVYQAVLEDMATNPAYGRLQVFQFPLGTSLSYIQAKMLAYQAMFQVDLFVLDYIGLIKGSVRRGDRREELDDIIQGLKMLAVGFADGRGVPVVSPYQIKRDAWEQAQQTRRYDKACLANTAEAERSADVVWSLLRLPDHPREVLCALIKNRDGSELPEFYLDVDMETSYMGAQERGGADLLNPLADL